ncbi:tetratricopeptide repeat protein, partial [candidate division CSSED10-310 bacterium]
KLCQLRRILFLKGNCYEVISKSYFPFLEIINEALLTIPEQLLSRYGAAFKLLLPHHKQLWKFKATLLDDPKLERGFLIHHITDFLLDFARAQENRVVLYLNNVQWADELSLETLKELLSKRKRSDLKKRLTIFCSSSDPNVPLCEPCYSQLIAKKLITELSLSPLSAAAGATYIEAVFGPKSLGPRLQAAVPAIIQMVNGNILFLQEFIKSLVVQGLITRLQTTWELNQALQSIEAPQTHEDCIRNQIRRIDLTVDEKICLQLLALLNRGVEIDDFRFILADRVDVSTQTLFSKLERQEILRSSFLEGKIVYYLSHPLIRKVIAAELENKTELHRYLAERLEKGYGHRQQDIVEELAYHFSQSDHKPKALHYLEKAGDKAKDEYANDKAIDYYDQLLAGLDNDEEKKIQILMKKCAILDLTGKWDTCKSVINTCLALAQEVSNDLLIARSKHFLGHICSCKGDYEQALLLFHEALAIFQELQEKKRIGRICGDMGNVYFNMGNYAEALNSYQTWLKTSKELGDKQGVSKVILNIGNIYMRTCHYDRAMRCFEKKIKLDREIGNIRGESNALRNTGILYKMLGNYDGAMECYRKTLDIATELGDKKARGASIANMGNVYLSLMEYHKAENCFRTLLEIAQDLGDKLSMANALGSLGTVSMELGKFELAMDYFNQVYEIAHKQGNKFTLCIAVGQKGQLFQRLKNYDNAEEYYNRSIDACRELHFKNFLLKVLHEKATLCFALKRLEEAQKCNDEAQALADEINYKELLFEIQLLTAKIQYYQTTDPLEKQRVVDHLKSLLPQIEDELQHAQLQDELYFMTTEKTFGQDALDKYKKLYARTQDVSVKERLQELQTALKQKTP